jgi:transcriptional regulator with XRE-family HTH domain
VVKEKGTLPTIRSRELGAGLRAAMRASGMGVRDLARRLGWAHPYVSHLLSGNRSYSETDLLSVLFACGVKQDERQRLLRLAAESRTQGWLQQYDSVVPEQPRTLLDHEREAVSVSGTHLVVLPKSLQTEEYARATLAHAAKAENTEARVRARLARQDVFTRSPPPRMVYFLPEGVVRATMSGQLHHLLRMSVRPSLELRVIPSALGVHAGHAGSFTLMEFAKREPVVYLESEVSAVFLEQPHQIAAYRRILAALDSDALDRTASRELITAIALEHSGDFRSPLSGHSR